MGCGLLAGPVSTALGNGLVESNIDLSSTEWIHARLKGFKIIMKQEQATLERITESSNMHLHSRSVNKPLPWRTGRTRTSPSEI